MEALAEWEVKPLADCRKASNVILFIGDGMDNALARLCAHRQCKLGHCAHIVGAGGRYFTPNAKNGNVSQIDRFIEKGYGWSFDNTTLQALPNDKRALGVFSAKDLPCWLDRNVYTDNLADFGAWDPENKTFTAPATDSPNLLSRYSHVLASSSSFAISHPPAMSLPSAPQNALEAALQPDAADRVTSDSPQPDTDAKATQEEMQMQESEEAMHLRGGCGIECCGIGCCCVIS